MTTEERKRKAARLLTNYARLGLEASGGTWGSDNDAEIETLVDLLIGAPADPEERARAEVDDNPESGDLSYEAWRRTHRVTA